MFKPIKGYENRYLVSISGEVLTLPYHAPKKKGGTRFFPSKRLKAGKSGGGYYTVSLYKDGKAKTFPIHRLVAESFLLPIEGKNCVNHRDGDKENNNVTNLEWCDYSDNIRHAYRTGLRKAGFAGKCY